jgi:hypothetical protein
MLDHHLNKHSATLDCNICHSPVYAKQAPTKTWWDWSKAGDKQRKPVLRDYGDGKPLPDYNVKKGEFSWQRAVKPEYTWFNGHMQRVLLGDSVAGDEGTVMLTAPIGARNDPSSRVTPFKIMQGMQAFDDEHKTLLIPHLFPYNAQDKTAYWKNYAWSPAFAEGMRVAGLPFSGSWTWRETWTYWRVEHEVLPARLALACSQCHASLQGDKTCDRCHQDSRHLDFKALAHKSTDFSYLQPDSARIEQLQHSSDYLNFKALGYPGDPILYGGRFKQAPLGR